MEYKKKAASSFDDAAAQSSYFAKTHYFADLTTSLN